MLNESQNDLACEQDLSTIRVKRLEMLDNARKRSRKKQIPFALTLEDIAIPTHCPVLGIPLKFGKGKVDDNSPTLDKVKPALGYVKGNVCVISWRANCLKSNGTPEELSAVVKYMLHFESLGNRIEPYNRQRYRKQNGHLYHRFGAWHVRYYDLNGKQHSRRVCGGDDSPTNRDTAAKIKDQFLDGLIRGVVTTKPHCIMAA